MKLPVRVLVPLASDSPEAWVHALGYAKVIAQEVPGTRELILLTHTKAQLTGTALSAHVGVPQAKLLAAGRSLDAGDGQSLRYATLKTLRGAGREVVFIAYFADEEMLDRLDGMDGVAGIVAVPWIAGELDAWVRQWNAKVHGAAPRDTEVLVGDPVVVKALTALTNAVNLSRSIMHASDKARANETLRILRAKGHPLEPADIKAWAVRNGWKPGAATELTALATRISNLKSKPSLNALPNADANYARWSE